MHPPNAPDLNTLFREHARFVWRLLRRMGVAESEVEDACQEVFLVVHRRLGDFEGRSSLRTWIYGIALRVASDFRKRERRLPSLDSEFFPDLPSKDNPHDTVGMERARATLDRILEGLDDDKRAAFVLFEIEELPMAEVAETMGCPLQTAYSRLHVAREKIGEAIARGQAESRRLERCS